MSKVERVLPIAVDAVNDPPKVVTPHHHVIKFGAFGIWSRYLTTQAGLSATKGNLTVGISTDTNSGQVVLNGVGTENVTFQVNKAFHGRNIMPLLALMPRLKHLCARYIALWLLRRNSWTGLCPKSIVSVGSQTLHRRERYLALPNTESIFVVYSGRFSCPPRRFQRKTCSQVHADNLADALRLRCSLWNTIEPCCMLDMFLW